MPARKGRYSAKKQVRALARERVGTVPPTRRIDPETRRRKLKHKKQELEEGGS
jgi:hypothetical protein